MECPTITGLHLPFAPAARQVRKAVAVPVGVWSCCLCRAGPGAQATVLLCFLGVHSMLPVMSPIDSSAHSPGCQVQAPRLLPQSSAQTWISVPVSDSFTGSLISQKVVSSPCLLALDNPQLTSPRLLSSNGLPTTTSAVAASLPAGPAFHRTAEAAAVLEAD